ncbi:MAG: DUF1554 domain-containing protein [Thiotrichaceae bacterium]|nr:DUF1554 domain-containing protein [Thiotrichaceae bacterium]
MKTTAKNIFLSRNYPLHKTLIKSSFCVIALITSGQTIAAAPDVTTNVVIYSLTSDGGGNQAGNMGGRAGADALCAASGARPLTGATANTQYRAFLSVSATDEIRDMPTNYNVPTTLPIVGNYPAATTTPIVGNWAALLNGTTLTTTMQLATGATNVGYWTGSDGTGAISAARGNCNGWTSNLVGVTGDVGTHNSTVSPNWLNGGWAGFTCDLTYNMLCVAFTPPSIVPISASINLSDSVKASTFSKELTVK